MTPAFTRNHFELLGIAPSFALEPSVLESRYRELQGRVHPDRFAAAPEAERRLAQLAAVADHQDCMVKTTRAIPWSSPAPQKAVQPAADAWSDASISSHRPENGQLALDLLATRFEKVR